MCNTTVHHCSGRNVITSTTLNRDKAPFILYFCTDCTTTNSWRRVLAGSPFSLTGLCETTPPPPPLTWSSFLTQNNLVWWRFCTTMKVIPGLYPDSNFRHASRTAFNSWEITWRITEILWNLLGIVRDSVFHRCNPVRCCYLIKIPVSHQSHLRGSLSVWNAQPQNHATRTTTVLAILMCSMLSLLGQTVPRWPHHGRR